MRVFLIALTLVAIAAPAALGDGPRDREREITFFADRAILESEQGVVRAEGNVSLETEHLRLGAVSLRIDPERRRISALGPLRLHTGGLEILGGSLVADDSGRWIEISAPRLELDREAGIAGARIAAARARCDTGGCTLEGVSGTSCPHRPVGWRVDAEQLVLHPSGDIDIERARLVVDGRSVAALPWLRVRPPGSAGFLAPRLGWSPRAGLIAGPAGQFPVGDHLLLRGHVAARTSQGLETSTEALLPAGRARLDHLFDAPENHLRARLDLFLPLEGASLAADADVVSDRRIVEELELEPRERALGHTSSRLLLATGGSDFRLESAFAAQQEILPGGGIADDRLGPSTSIRACLIPLAVSRAVWPGLAVELSRRDGWRPGHFSGARGLPTPPHTRISAAPSLESQQRAGPLGIEVRAATSHVLWLPDGAGERRRERHSLSALAGLELPLVGYPLGLRHRLTPLVRYRATPWIAGGSPRWTVDDLDRVVAGQGIDAGLRTSLGLPGKEDVARLSIAERLALPGLGSGRGAQYLDFSLRVGDPRLSAEARAAWDHRERLPSLSLLDISSSTSRGNEISAGAAWYGPGRGPHLDGGWRSTRLLLLDAWPREPEGTLEVHQRARAVLTDNLSAAGGAIVAVHPNPRMLAVWYGLELGSSCGCLSAGLQAIHRPGNPLPDIMATLDLSRL
ncbi:MAG: hypothetical protein R6V85_02265 [Polyangia bacterium]